MAGTGGRAVGRMAGTGGRAVGRMEGTDGRAKSRVLQAEDGYGTTKEQQTYWLQLGG